MNGLKGVFLLAVVFLAAGVNAATLKGTVFDSSLEPIKAIVTINTTPEQTFVAQNGSFYFELQRGTFQITAVAKNYSVSETVSIVSEGVFNIDLVLLSFDAPDLDIPNVTEESSLVNPDNQTPNGQESRQSQFDWNSIMLPLVVLIFAAIVFFFNREFNKAVSEIKKLQKTTIKEKREKRREKPAAAIRPIPTAGLNDLQQEILEELGKNEGRMTQKELRKLLPFSEAKISIELDFLEEKGLIKKFKKGRGNVVVLVEK